MKFGKLENRFTRVGFCPNCYKAGRPKGTRFNPKTEETEWTTVIWLWCGTGQKWKLLPVQYDARAGYVPHLFEFIAQIGNKVHYRKTCLVDGCDTEANEHQTPRGMVYVPYPLSSTTKFMLEKDWRALISFTDTCMKL